jgi:hypothetical protein
MAVTHVNVVHIVLNEHGGIFSELIQLITDSIESCGVATRRARNTAAGDGLNLFVGATVFLTPPNFQSIRQAGPYVVFQVEALGQADGFVARHPDYLDFLRGAAQVWDYSESNVRFLRDHGCQRVHYIPIGYSPRLERIPRDAAKSVDVVFYGAITPRRRAVLENLHRRGASVRALFGVYGAARDREIGRARIVLNIHQFELAQLEQVRLSYLLNNRCFVVSETADCNPYGEGVVFCPYDDLAACCESYLQAGMDLERDRVAGIGQERLKSFAMAASVQAALAAL